MALGVRVPQIQFADYGQNLNKTYLGHYDSYSLRIVHAYSLSRGLFNHTKVFDLDKWIKVIMA